jgi:hypothetical protein
LNFVAATQGRLLRFQAARLVVQALLGHANARTTQRYAHLASDTLTDATEIVDGIVAAQRVTITPPSAAVAAW